MLPRRPELTTRPGSSLFEFFQPNTSPPQSCAPDVNSSIVPAQVLPAPNIGCRPEETRKEQLRVIN